MDIGAPLGNAEADQGDGCMRILLFGLCLALGGCAATDLESYRGHPITDVAARYGPPIEVQNLASGERAFIWTLDAKGRPGPPPPWHFQSAEQQANFRKGNFFDGACVYQLIGRQDGKTGEWIVRRLVDPGLSCR